MNEVRKPRKDAAGRPPSLEQKIRRLVRQYRAVQRRRLKGKAGGAGGLRPHRGSRLVVALILNLFPLALLSAATSAQPGFDEALQASASGHDGQAAAIYRQILAEQGNSVPALYNLGNTLYHQGQWGPAILDYERALWLAPHDSDVATNLRLAQTKAGLPVAVASRWDNATRWVNANTAAWIGSVALALTGLTLLLRRWVTVSGRGFWRTAVTGSCIVALLALADVGYWWTRLDRAVILSAKTSAHIAPASAAARLFGLNEGQVVQTGRSHGDFVLIRTADGHSGWVSRERVARIVPRQSRPAGGQPG